MAKVLVVQHVPYEPLGTIVSLLRQGRHRLKHINFVRQPEQKVSIKGYDALIILGGPMNVDETADYPFLLKEIQLIKLALAQDIPILGICLGAQLIAKALGAAVYPAKQREVGWYPVTKVSALNDPILKHFDGQQQLFQWHCYTFDLPEQAEHLLASEICPNQAFRYGDKVYGFQFHLEASEHLIERWLSNPESLSYIEPSSREQKIETIKTDTEQLIEQSIARSHNVFQAFLALLPKVRRKMHLRSR